MVNMAGGIARGRVLSLTTTMTTVSHQYGNLSHASLVNIRSHKGSHQPITWGIHFNWQLSKQETRWAVSHDHIGVAQDAAQRKYTGQLGSTYAGSFLETAWQKRIVGQVSCHISWHAVTSYVQKVLNCSFKCFRVEGRGFREHNLPENELFKPQKCCFRPFWRKFAVITINSIFL